MCSLVLKLYECISFVVIFFFQDTRPRILSFNQSWGRVSPLLTPPPTCLEQFPSKGSYWPPGERFASISRPFITETAHLLDLLLLSAVLIIPYNKAMDDEG